MANPTQPSLRAVRRIMQLSRELPVTIRHRMVLVNRLCADSPTDVVERELEPVGAERLPDVPDDPAVERAGAVGESVFTLAAENPAYAAVQRIAQLLCDRTP